MSARGALTLLLASSSAAGLRVPRRTAVAVAISGAAIGKPQTAAASKFPQHVEDLDRAASAKDVPATQAALRTLGLTDSAEQAKIVIEHTGDASKLRPAVSKIQQALTSTKITVTVPGATPSMDDNLSLIHI